MKITVPWITTFFVCLLLTACSTLDKIYTEKDIVTGTKRIELEYRAKDKAKRSPLHYVTQSIVKEIDPQNEITYTAYDVLRLSASSFKIEEKVFFIIDNEAYPMTLEKLELENVKDISENRSDILTSDSTSVSVVTGYTENNNKIARFKYTIPEEVIRAIRQSRQMALRYYAGPNMITAVPKPRSLYKIKELIDAK